MRSTLEAGVADPGDYAARAGDKAFHMPAAGRSSAWDVRGRWAFQLRTG